MESNDAQAGPGPTISLAIPSFNGERYLEETISSALEQTLPVSELRVLDNASTDRSVQVARSVLPSTSVLVHRENIGAAENFKAALVGSSESEFFAWLAVGDRLAPEFLETCVAALNANPDLPACLTGIRFIDADGVQIGTQTDQELGSVEPSRRLRSFLRRSRWTEFYCLYRRAALLESPGVVAGYGSDVILTWWFLLRSPLAVTGNLLLDYRIEGEKTVTDVDTSLNPAAERTHWHMHRLWHALWSMTRAPDLDPATARTARRELLLALADRHWVVHLGADLADRWPALRRPGLRIKARLVS